jgi:hypothetical protein
LNFTETGTIPERCEVLTALNMKIMVRWNVTPCSLIERFLGNVGICLQKDTPKTLIFVRDVQFIRWIFLIVLNLLLFTAICAICLYMNENAV